MRIPLLYFVALIFLACETTHAETDIQYRGLKGGKANSSSSNTGSTSSNTGAFNSGPKSSCGQDEGEDCQQSQGGGPSSLVTVLVLVSLPLIGFIYLACLSMGKKQKTLPVQSFDERVEQAPPRVEQASPATGSDADSNDSGESPKPPFAGDVPTGEADTPFPSASNA